MEHQVHHPICEFYRNTLASYPGYSHVFNVTRRKGGGPVRLCHVRDVTTVAHLMSVGEEMLWSSHVGRGTIAQLQRWLHESARLCREVSFFVWTSLS